MFFCQKWNASPPHKISCSTQLLENTVKTVVYTARVSSAAGLNGKAYQFWKKIPYIVEACQKCFVISYEVVHNAVSYAKLVVTSYWRVFQSMEADRERYTEKIFSRVRWLTLIAQIATMIMVIKAYLGDITKLPRQSKSGKSSENEILAYYK